ncbi:DNA-3-methyladenine glycosylase [Halospeciosus flavus]|uniref:Putative 3-methyladenine DNA glycosylase n=1 Tax=Halospeciosus flavus TaxID=3032283 RepID=A0ABD5Z0R1_9EURY|nr:DNA-3-methyladenine glycosylase [Halospeciosus flavus]
MPHDADDFERGDALDTEFFRRQGRHVARDLVGTLLLNESDDGTGDGTGGETGDETDGGPVGGLVVEAEAYVNAIDPACHLSAGRTPRTEPFFRGAGTVYVFSMHGHHLLNVITAYEDHPEGVLLRALEPTHGRERMHERRGRERTTELTSGPGKLTEALGVTKEAYDGRPLAETSLSFYETDWDPEVQVSPRIGVTGAEDWPLRFTAAGSDCLSKPARTDVPLDFAAVERCYERLREDARGGGEELPTVDR